MVTKQVEFSLTKDGTKEKKNKPDVLNIFQRLNNVMKEVKTIYKDGTNSHQKYKFVSHDNVSKALHDPLCDNGIMMVPTVKQCEQDGNKVTVTMEVTFVNIDDPDDRIAVTTIGIGIDNQDKGIGKAISYAMKYCMLKMFCLETGDDADNETVSHKPQKKAAPDQEKAFQTMIPNAIDKTAVESFLIVKAQQNKTTREKVVASALANKEAFLKALEDYSEEDVF